MLYVLLWFLVRGCWIGMSWRWLKNWFPSGAPAVLDDASNVWILRVLT